MARLRFDRDYYRIMGLPAEATEDEIRRSYRRLALEFHPDRNPGRPQAAERFKEISEAYAVLIDPSKRGEYDRVRHAGGHAEFRHSREDLFRDLFADPRASAVFDEIARELARMGVRVDRRDFRQTLFGGRTVISGSVIMVGSFTPMLAMLRLARAAIRGARAASPVAPPEPRSLPRPPGVLAAIGRIGRWLLGPPATSSPASPAERDVVVPLRLTAAEAERGGRKLVALGEKGRSDEVVVSIPPGVRAGTRLRLRGKGRPGPHGARGDAYLAVEVVESS